MKLNKYLEYLSKYAEKYGHLELEVIYSEDVEGNYFSKVVYHPILGNFSENDFISIANIPEHFETEEVEKYINAICVN